MSLQAGGPSAKAGPRLRVLGSFELRLDTVPVLLPVPAQRLLGYLAVANRPQPREALAGILWPFMSQSRAQACLRTAIWRVRRAGERIIDADHGIVTLHGDVDVDLWRMTDYARRLLEDAGVDDGPGDPLSLLESDLLPSWDEEWIGLERERVRQLRVHALEELSRQLRRAGRFAAAVQAAYAAIAAEPLRESAHAVLMEVHLAEGNRAQATRHLAAYRRLLDDELGIPPSPRLQALVARPA